MDIKKISDAAGEILEFLKAKDLKADEKIAALRSAASTIESVVAGEVMTQMNLNFLTRK